MTDTGAQSVLQPVLELTGIDKEFAGNPVLRNVQLCLYPGEIHALMGQNGAGKSTRIKVLTGVLEFSGGQIFLSGQPIRPDSPLAAQKLGISTVYQEVNLCPNLSVAENVFAGHYPRYGWTQGYRIDWSSVHRRARELLARIGLDIDVTQLLSTYPVAVQQLVAIARALGVESKVLILDEPTSSLDEDEVQKLFEVLRRLRGEGLAIVFVSHFLNQVYAISDRITVLRNGEWMGEWLANALPPQALISAMLGREFAVQNAHAGQQPDAARDVVLLQTQGLGQTGRLLPVDLKLHAGEVLGLAGLLGAGRTELARLLFGLEAADKGSLQIDGHTAHLGSPADAVQHGIALCPEERKTDGIVAELSVRENIALALQARLGVRKFLSIAEQTTLAEHFVKTLDIKTASIETPIGLLSGGNQQKAVIARWLATDPRLLILDEPTRGIDISVGAVVAISAALAAWMVGGALVVQDGVAVHASRFPMPLAILAALGVAVATLGSVFFEGFFSLQVFLNLLIDNAFLVIVAVGMTFVVLSGGIDLSVGSVIALIALGVAVFMAHCTPFGRTVYAVGGSEHSALLMGLPVRATLIGVYTLSGFYSALAGVVFTFYMLSGYGLHAVGMELDAIVAVVIGGTLLTGGSGYMVGTLFGVLMLGIIQTLISFDGSLSSWWTRIVVGALLFLFCLLQCVFAAHKSPQP